MSIGTLTKETVSDLMIGGMTIPACPYFTFDEIDAMLKLDFQSGKFWIELTSGVALCSYDPSMFDKWMSGGVFVNVRRRRVELMTLDHPHNMIEALRACERACWEVIQQKEIGMELENNGLYPFIGFHSMRALVWRREILKLDHA